MDIRARQPIGGGDHHQLKSGKGGMVAQPVEAGAIELCARIAIVAIDMLLGQLPVTLSNNVSTQELELLLNRLGLVLTRARDPRVECHVHCLPPAVWGPSTSRLTGSSPTASRICCLRSYHSDMIPGGK